MTLSESLINSMMIREAIANKNMGQAHQLMKDYFKKHKIFVLPSSQEVFIDGTNYYGKVLFSAKTHFGAYVLFAAGGTSTEVRGVTFFKNASITINIAQFGGQSKGDVFVALRDVSLGKLLPFIADVLDGKLKMDKRSLTQKLDSYQMWNESAEGSEVTVAEAADDIAELTRKKNNIYQNLSYARKTNSPKLEQYEKEYEEIKNKLDSLRVGVSNNVSVRVAVQHDLDFALGEFEKRATPKERFKDMALYIRMVLQGIKPLALVCGAPGIGKTYRITNQIDATGRKMDVDYTIVKGRVTPLALYEALYECQKSGQILVMDDADDVVNDDGCINLIKAATDSSRVRTVSYRSSLMPEMSQTLAMEHPEVEPGSDGKVRYPNHFVFEGGIIIITNLYVTEVDSAIKNRALLCNLEFTTQEILDIVKDVSQYIEIKGDVDQATLNECKERAFTFLQGLVDRGATNVDISIRSFKSITEIYAACDEDEDAAKRCIVEQLKLLSMRRAPGQKRKY